MLTSPDRFPLLVTMILVVIGACGFLSMRLLLMLENRRRARIISSWTAEDFEAEASSNERRGDMKLTFRHGY
jgi:acyl CoA:acetate/3-ketoacid CoA transferase alpha subunit